MLLWFEGFEADQNDTDMVRKYEAVSALLSGFFTGRWGGSGLRLDTSPGTQFRTRNLGNRNNAVMGCNLFIREGTISAEQKLFALLDGTNEQIALYWLQASTGQIQFRVKRGSTVIGTTSSFWANGWYILVEWKVLLDTTGSNGSVELRVNGISELLVAGIDTTDFASLVWNRALFVASSPSFANPLGTLDDVYVLDSAGAVNNDWLGEHAIEKSSPGGNGNRNQWDTGPVPAQPNHFSFVSENTIDDDNSFLFIHNTDDNKVELFAMSDLTFLTDPVYGLLLEYDLRMDTGGQDNIQPKFRNAGGTEAAGTPVTINQVSPYKRFIEIFESDPTIAGAWTVANWNAMQVGLESLP